MQSNEKQHRRRHSDALKAKVLEACAAPGASVAAVAREHGLNDNLVHQWRRGRGAGQRGRDTDAARFIALSLPTNPEPERVADPTPVAMTPMEIRIEFKRGGVQVNVAWPMTAIAQSAAWLREVLR